VRATVGELRAAHRPTTDESGPIPKVQARRRRRLDGFGVKVPVRLYPPERQALQELADELGLSIAALVTEAVVARYAPRRPG
jgi:hypothetical protein